MSDRLIRAGAGVRLAGRAVAAMATMCSAGRRQLMSLTLCKAHRSESHETPAKAKAFRYRPRADMKDLDMARSTVQPNPTANAQAPANSASEERATSRQNGGACAALWPFIEVRIKILMFAATCRAGSDRRPVADPAAWPCAVWWTISASPTRRGAGPVFSGGALGIAALLARWHGPALCAGDPVGGTGGRRYPDGGVSTASSA